MNNQFTLPQLAVWSLEESLGEWRLAEHLGSGSQGEVYRIEKTLPITGTQTAALKVIPLPGDPAAAQTIEGKYAAFSSLGECPHLMRIFDTKTVESDNGRFLLVIMELLEPAPTEAIGEEACAGMLRDILDALRFLHSSEPPVLHLDIKPENIMRSADGVWKLCDFGETEYGERVAAFGSGTPMFCAPELYLRGTADASSDICSLGVTAYTMLNGCPPFCSKNEHRAAGALQKRLDGERLPDIDGVSGGFLELIRQMCASDPHWRYHSAAEVLAALEKYTKSGSVGKVRRKSAAVPVIAAVCAVLAAAAAIFLWTTSAPEAETAPEGTPVRLSTGISASAEAGLKAAEPAAEASDKASSAVERELNRPEWVTDSSLTLFGREIPLDTVYLDMAGMKIDDPELLITALDYLPQLEKVDFTTCPIPPQTRSALLNAVGEHGIDFLLLDDYYQTIYDTAESTELSLTAPLSDTRQTAIGDLSCLQYFKKLEVLQLYSADCTGLMKYITGMDTLKVLIIHDGGLTGIDGLQTLTGLEALDLQDNKLTDISPLAEMTWLKDLFLEYNSITDLRPLAGLTQLEALSVRENPVADWSPLKELTALVNLGVGPASDDAQRDVIRDLITAQTGLIRLQLDGVGFDDHSFLAGLPALEAVDLYSDDMETLKREQEQIKDAVPSCVCTLTENEEPVRYSMQ